MDQAHAIGRRLQRENDGRPVKCPDFYGAMERELGLGNEEIQKLLDILERDGRVYRPTPYTLSFVGWEVEP